MILLGFQCLRPNPTKSQPFTGALSICSDYCDHLPETWCLDWTTPRVIPGDFTPDEVVRMANECTDAFGGTWEWPDLMTEERWARSFHERWAKDRGYRLLAVACADRDRLTLIDATRPPHPLDGFSPMGSLGIHVMATRLNAIDEAWRVLGWEVLDANSATIGDCHSDPTAANAVTRLMPCYETADKLVRDLHGQPNRPSWVQPIPIALIEVPSVAPESE